MKRLIEDSIRILLDGISQDSNPAIYFSGGKDSVVMLHLITQKFKIPMEIVFHQEPFMDWKNDFGRSVLREFGCFAYDWLPSATSLWIGKSIIAYTNYFQITPKSEPIKTMMLPKNITEPEPGMPWLCGRDAFFARPFGGIDYKWDVAIIGHKSSDEDQIAGKVPLHADTFDAGPVTAVFPLRNWTDADVWRYTKENNLPIDHRRYNSDTEKELPEKNWNIDYYAACIACMDRRRKGDVLCPKTGKMIPSVAESTPYHESPNFDYYGVKEKALI